MDESRFQRGVMRAANVVAVAWFVWSLASWIAYYALELERTPPWWGGYW